MATQPRGIANGINLFKKNSTEKVSILFGTAAPGGDAGDQDNANQGSIFIRSTGKLYTKETSGTGADKWVQLPSFGDLNSIAFRSKLLFVTADNITSGVSRDFTAVPISDDDTPLLSATDFTVGDLIISDIDGTPRLMKCTAVAAPNATFTDEASALVANDNFVVEYHLPDNPGNQENRSLIHYTGSGIIKLGDADWEFATGISLTGGYAVITGSVAGGDTVEVAIAKLDKRTLDLVTLSGVAANAVDLGTFTGAILSDNLTIKQAFQEIETAIEGLETQVKLIGVTTVQTLDSVLVDDILSAEWEVVSTEDATPVNRQVKKVLAVHNGHTGADASVVDESTDGILKLGSNFNNDINVVLTGVGAAQQMELQVLSSSAGVTFICRRTIIKA